MAERVSKADEVLCVRPGGDPRCFAWGRDNIHRLLGHHPKLREVVATLLPCLAQWLKEAAPTSGWLMKQGGRRAKTGLASMLSRDKKRWFVLTQPEEGQGATFRYYDSPPHIPSAPARGAVVLNRDATLEVRAMRDGSNLGGWHAHVYMLDDA